MFRKIFFYSLVSLFLVLLPVTLLYSLGFRWDFQNNTLTRTGIITIKTFPEAADIYVNGQKHEEKTPANLSGLLPGTYEIELKLKGYWPYLKKVNVQADHVTRLEDILFFPKIPKFKSILKPEKANSFFLAPSGKRILFVSDSPGEDNFFLLHLGDNALRALGSVDPARAVLLRGLEASWSLDDEIILLHNERIAYLLFVKKPAESYFLNDVIGFHPERVKMSASRNAELYYLKKGKITRFDIRKRQEKTKFLDSIVDFEPTDFGLLWMKEESAEIFRSDRDGQSAKQFGRLRNFQALTPLSWQSTSKSFLKFEPGKWGALDEGGNFYVLQPSFYHPAVKGFRFSPSGKKLLFWNDYELWLLIEDSGETKESGSPRYSRELIFESEIPIQHAFWSSDEHYVFFLTHRKVYVLEVATEGGVNLYPFYVSKNHFIRPGGWAIDEEEGLFYWLTEGPGNYRQLRLLRLSVGFLEPIVSKVVDQMESFKSKIQSPELFREEIKTGVLKK